MVSRWQKPIFMHVVLVENILNNHSSDVVYNTRPQAYDTELLDLEIRPGKKTRQKYICPSTARGTLTGARYFRVSHRS